MSTSERVVEQAASITASGIKFEYSTAQFQSLGCESPPNNALSGQWESDGPETSVRIADQSGFVSRRALLDYLPG